MYVRMYSLIILARVVPIGHPYIRQVERIARNVVCSFEINQAISVVIKKYYLYNIDTQGI